MKNAVLIAIVAFLIGNFSGYLISCVVTPKSAQEKWAEHQLDVEKKAQEDRKKMLEALGSKRQ